MGPVNSFVRDVFGGIVTMYNDGAITSEEAHILSVEMARTLALLSRAMIEEQGEDVIPREHDDRGDEYDYYTEDDKEFDNVIDSYERLSDE